MASNHDETQNKAVLKRLSKGWLTSDGALKELGVSRLAARINDLKDRGTVIERSWHFVPTRTGKMARIRAYRVAPPSTAMTGTAQLDALLGGARAPQRELALR